MQKEALIGDAEGNQKKDKSLTHGLYLYCLYHGTASFPDLIGIDRDQKVFSLYYRGINAAVSWVRLEEFGTRALEQNQRSGELDWLAPRVLIHERVIEEIMAVCPVMPMRFGNIFAGRREIDKLLKIHHGKVARFFKETADKEEWGVKGYIINGGRLEVTSKKFSPAVGVRLEDASPGHAYLLRKKRDLATKDARSGFAAQIGEEVFQNLLVHAIKGVRNKALKVETGEERGRMILNSAFLVPKTDVGLFQAKVKEREEKYRSQGLNLIVTGPWPPYNFCPGFSR